MISVDYSLIEKAVRVIKPKKRYPAKEALNKKKHYVKKERKPKQIKHKWNGVCLDCKNGVTRRSVTIHDVKCIKCLTGCK